MPNVDYQELISIIANLVKIAGGIGIIFRISDYIVGTFFDWAFPRRHHRGE